MHKVDLTRPALSDDATFVLDGVTVRMVRIPGAERSAIRVRFEILDDKGRVVRAMLSRPSAAECRDAVRAAAHPPPVAVTEPQQPKFNPTIEHTRKRAQERRKRQMAEEADED